MSTLTSFVMFSKPGRVIPRWVAASPTGGQLGVGQLGGSNGVCVCGGASLDSFVIFKF